MERYIRVLHAVHAVAMWILDCIVWLSSSAKDRTDADTLARLNGAPILRRADGKVPRHGGEPGTLGRPQSRVGV
jgi:hypothetical protein